jgi:hypothetical protein
LEYTAKAVLTSSTYWLGPAAPVGSAGTHSQVLGLASVMPSKFALVEGISGALNERAA